MVDVVLISGKARSGKDSVANFIARNAKYDSIISLHFASPVKLIAKNDFGWNGVKDEKGRQLLQLIGDGGRSYNPNIWVEKLLDSLNSFVRSYINSSKLLVLIPDTRYKNEVMKLLEWGDIFHNRVFTVRIERPNFDNGLTKEQLNNSSEMDLDDWGIWDVKITNDSSLENLQLSVLNMMEVLGIEYRKS